MPKSKTTKRSRKKSSRGRKRTQNNCNRPKLTVDDARSKLKSSDGDILSFENPTSF